MSIAALPPPPAPGDASDLSALLLVLLERTGAVATDDQVRRAAAEAGPPGEPDGWPDRLTCAAMAAGLRVRWTRGTEVEAAELSRPDLPVVTCRVGPAGPRWVVLAGARLGHVDVQTVEDVLPPRRVPIRNLATRVLDAAPEAAHTWALIEPALPASPVLPRAEGSPAPTPLQRLRALLRAEKPDLASVVLYAIAIGLLSLATPLAMQVLINWLAFGALQQPIVVLTVILFTSLALAAGLQALQRFAVEIVQRRIFVRMVADLTTRLTRVRIEAFDNQYGPELVNRFFDVLTVQKAVAKLMLDGVGAALQAMVGLALLALYHPALLGFDILVVLAVLAVMFGLGRGATKTAIKESKAKYAVASWIEELARHPMVFKLGDGETLALERADLLSRDYLTTRDQHWRIYFRQFVGTQALRAVATVGLLGLCGWLVLDGQLTVGQLVAAEFIVTSALAGLAKFAGKLDTLYDLLAGIDKLGQLVDLPQERITGVSGPRRADGASVQLRGVRFQYPGSPSGVGPLDLRLDPGERVSVLGVPGVGKSTLTELLLGVRQPTAGVVERDGVDLRDLRPQVAWQDAMLTRGVDIFHGTIAENVALGRGGAATPEVRRAVEAVGLADAVGKLAAGLDTVLGPNGAPLSTSEARRLMLARALAARPRLVVIDGLLDGIPNDQCRSLLAPFLSPDAPWTLLLLTEDPALAALLPRQLTLTREGLDG